MILLSRPGWNGRTDIVCLLLEHGVVMEARDNIGCTPLHDACDRGRTDTARLLLERGADAAAKDNDNWTPLHRACAEGHIDIARLLIEAGVDVNVEDNNGITPLDLVLALNLKPDNPAREEIIDLFREYAPDLVMEKWCTTGPGL